MTNLSTLIAKTPTGSGVYKFLDEKQQPLYVGKAKNLKKRLQSYVRKSAQHGVKTTKMLEQARGIEWTETNNEIEALILEDNLVKTLQPKYNVLLKDDKYFQYIKVSVQDDYPEITSVRRIIKDGARYFGPKTSGGDVSRLMESAKKIFKLCSKKIKLDPKGTPLKGAKVAVKAGGSVAKRPCLDYHIKRCTGPCAGMVTPQEYKGQINDVLDFLSGNYKPAIQALKEQMMGYAADRKFERAAAIRNQINAIDRSAQKQLITDTSLEDRDVIAFVEDMGKNYFVLFQVRAGKLIGEEKFISEGGELPTEVMEAFLREYYGLAADIPKEILIGVAVDEGKLMESYIRGQTDHAVRLIHPHIGKKDDLIMLAEKNARSYAEASRVRWEANEKRAEAALKELKEVLKLPEEPKRIECFDISHLSGTETVGSMVVFKKGRPMNADYRQFRLRTTVDQNDDFKSMNEVVTRRLNYLPAKLPEGYKLRKAKKDDEKAIDEAWKNLEEKDVKQFHIIEHKNKVVALGRIHTLSEKVDELNGLWVSEKQRGKRLGYFILRKLIETSQKKRLYMFCNANLKEYYLKIGFELIHKAPKEMADKVRRVIQQTGEPFEPLYMAYQKRKKDRSFTAWPDLMVIDGGKGQLSAAMEAIEGKGMKIPIISLAKREEEVFVPGKSEPINLKNNSEGSYLLQRIRDEAHRFAINHNRSSRDNKMTKSALDSIPGVGAKLKKRLLTHFGSVAQIREASQVQLASIAGEGIAKRLKENL
jgi:excinuclease ABC subunit C